MSHEQHLAGLKEDWAAQTAIFKKIEECGVQGYFASLPALGKAFDADSRHVHCMDERTPHGIHCAGSGILLGLDAAAEFCTKSGAMGISSHEGCGAAGIYARLNNLAGDPDGFGIEFAKKLAKKTGLPYVGHLLVKRKYHFARAAYYDGTGVFDSTKVAGLPPGFFINRANFNPEYAVNTEAATAARIAMSDHGYGDLISAENPFYFFAIGNGKLPMEELLAELEPLKREFGDKIVITGFNAPAKK